ncbi:MAG: hypothetical protein IMF07_01800 [Proteobacteria bacterium]|nr:hypothetical protein [Pseudomonadota bacterium]
MKFVVKNTLNMKIALVLMTTLLFSWGCAVAPKGPKRRLFFPPPPVEPKIEWKATYTNQYSFPRSLRQRRIEAILGRSPSIGFSRPMDTASDGKGLIYVTDPDSRNVYIYDTINYKIETLDKDGTGVFTLPLGIAVGADGRIYVSDRFRKKVLVFSADRKPLFTIGGEGELEAPVGVAVDNINNKIYVTDVKRHVVNAFDREGKLLYVLGRDKDERMGFNFPVDVDVLPDGSVVIVDTMNARVHIVDSKGNYVRTFGKRGDSIDAFELIKGVAVDKEGHIYLADVGSNSIKIYDVEGRLLLTFGGTYKSMGKLAAGGFTMIAGISADSNNGIFVADQMNRSVQAFQYLDEEYLKLNPLPESYDHLKTK